MGTDTNQTPPQIGTWRGSKPVWTSLDNALGKLIMRSRLAGSLPQLTGAEFEASVEAWREIIDGEVPESDLEAAYRRAMREKDSTFPLGAPEIVKGYRANVESERASPRIAQDSNLLPGEVCRKCYGSGMEQLIVNGYRQAQRCDHDD